MRSEGSTVTSGSRIRVVKRRKTSGSKVLGATHDDLIKEGERLAKHPDRSRRSRVRLALAGKPRGVW